jgi:hypothetical protein
MHGMKNFKIHKTCHERSYPVNVCSDCHCLTDLGSYRLDAGASGRVVTGVGLRPLIYCDRGFEFHWGRGCLLCVLSDRGLCDELITRPEESYRLWCVVVCDHETSCDEEAIARAWLQSQRK